MNRAQMMASTALRGSETPEPVPAPFSPTDQAWLNLFAPPPSESGVTYELSGRGHGIPPPGWCDGEVIETGPNVITVRFPALPDDLTECRFRFEPRMMVRETRPGGYIRSIDFTGGQEIAEW